MTRAKARQLTPLIGEFVELSRGQTRRLRPSSRNRQRTSVGPALRGRRAPLGRRGLLGRGEAGGLDLLGFLQAEKKLIDRQALARRRSPSSRASIRRARGRLRNGSVDFYVGPEAGNQPVPELAKELLFSNQRVVLCRARDLPT